LVSKDLRFTADDGVVPHATIGGMGGVKKRPLIVEDGPYADACYNAFAGPAYNYIQLPERGTRRGGGPLTSTGSRDQKDLSQFLRWACRPPWSDGASDSTVSRPRG
jgi:hypothetical protein